MPDFLHTSNYFEERLRDLLEDSVKYHLRSDVPVGAYVSGGLDSSAIASIASDLEGENFLGFTGKFSFSKDYDESSYARLLCDNKGFQLHEIDITDQDFINSINKVIYHLDYPVAGPGSFPQYMVSGLASKYRKVVLGGQGGDEILEDIPDTLLPILNNALKRQLKALINPAILL